MVSRLSSPPALSTPKAPTTTNKVNKASRIISIDTDDEEEDEVIEVDAPSEESEDAQLSKQMNLYLCTSSLLINMNIQQSE